MDWKARRTDVMIETTDEIVKRGDDFDVSFWADYFPDDSVIYRVRVNRIAPRTKHEFLAEGQLFASEEDSRPKNSSRRAAITVSDNGIKFVNVPQTSTTEGAARVSRIQKAGVTYVRLIVAYCD